MIICYIATVVLANFTTLWFGPSATIVNAFFLIGANLVLRDILSYRLTPVQMTGLIGLTGLASFLINPDTQGIAIASLVAFVVSSSVDWLVFVRSSGSWLSRSNKSNIFGAAVDSLIFPTLAFGALMPSIVLGQFVAKSVGGLMWALALNMTGEKK